jgi:signal transduction histidine kinase
MSTSAAWVRPAPTPAQQLRDVLVGLAVTAGLQVSLLLTRSAGLELGAARPSVAEEVLWGLAVTLPLCLRRRLPLAVLVVCSIAFIGLQSRFVGETTFSSVALFVALYTAGAWGQDRRITGAVRLVVVLAMFAWLAYALSAVAWDEVASDRPAADGPIPPHLASTLYSTLINILFFAGAWYFGDSAWNRARQDDELSRRTAELARERDENARRAVLDERVRIARELHDVVAHHVSVMGVQAGAARRVLAADPDLARSTLTGIEAAGRTAVTELQRLLLILRDEDAASGGTAPAPGVDGLPELFAGADGTLRTAFTVVGDERPIPAALSVSLFRIAQEALTNTIRHAGATRVDARLRYLDEAVELEVVDDGRGSGGTTVGSGLGQVGMRERIDLHGGDLEVGPRPGGGYRVRARVPLARLNAVAS